MVNCKIMKVLTVIFILMYVYILFVYTPIVNDRCVDNGYDGYASLALIPCGCFMYVNGEKIYVPFSIGD